MNSIISFSLAVAALLALYGTNLQAALSREHLINDEDPLVAAAGRNWVPLRWLSTPGRRHRLGTAESRVRENPALWTRYGRLRRELSAWNALESSVALAAVASIEVFITSLKY